jgi:hypothetical protein
MSLVLPPGCALEQARVLSIVGVNCDAEPAAPLEFLRSALRGSLKMQSTPGTATAAQTQAASQSRLETLPVEVFNHILSYLVHPRSRHPGLTEAESACDFSSKARFYIKGLEDLTTPPDSDRWASNLFNWTALTHPFHPLSLTSRRCHGLVESFCYHMVRSCNKFGLPFAQLEKRGVQSVYPDMSGIVSGLNVPVACATNTNFARRHQVYRRLWLQHAPRYCIYCYAALDCYPYRVLLKRRVIAACADCFYRQTLVSLTLPCPTTRAQ